MRRLVFLIGMVLSMLLFSSSVVALSATGGTITTEGNYTVHTFSSSGNFVVTGSGVVDVLLVAGGGGGGYGAGGGAGGLLYETNETVTSQSYSIVVGAGGAGATYAGITDGTNGSASTGLGFTADGGGAGGGRADGNDGGSGGGGGNIGTWVGGSATVGQGYDGGDAASGGSPYPSGGGGGAGGAGGNGAASQSGNGGAGVNNAINGSTVCYAGGGSGSATTLGGNRGTTTCGGGLGRQTAGNGDDGTDGLGGGGGGLWNAAGSIAGNGGDGIVIIRYLTPTGIPSTPLWVAPTPIDGVKDNIQVTLNATCDASQHFYIWFDDVTPPITSVLLNSSTGSYTTNVSVEDTYYYSAACYNVSADVFSVNSTPRSWTYDVQAPAILLNADNGFNDANRSVVDQFGDWLNLSMNFTDDNDLFAWNITINASNGTVMYSDQNSSLNGTSELMVRDLNVSSWLAGWFDVSVWVSDSHTAKEIKPYVVTVKKDKKGMEFKTKEGNLITLETEEDATLSAKKKKDRYEWDVDFLDGKSSSRTFHLWSDRPIVYREDSPYKAHFVVMNGQQGNWVDFEGVAEVPTIKKLSDYHYTINFKKLKTAKFKSIGGLNTYTRTWSWYRGTDVYDAERATEGDSFDIWFNLTYDPSFTIDASLLWNGTAQNVTQQNGSNWRYFSATFTNQSLGTYWYYWTINVTQDDGNVSQFTINETHAVEDWYIDACGGATVTTMRWRQYNENTPASALNGTAQVLIEYWPVSKNNSKIFNHTYGSANFFEVCLSPANLNFSADVYLQNTVAGAFTHRFYVQNGSFNNVTTNYTIFNFNNQTGLSDMKITTRLEDDYSYLENVLVYLQRQYIGEGVWRTVQMDRSGDYGLLFFNILEQNTDYRLIYYDVVNNLLHQTTSMKFVCGSGVCDLTQLLGDYEVTTTSDQVTAVVSFDNATRVITVDWSGPPAESHTVELAAIKETVTGPLTLCSGIQVGASGTFSCNASGVSGQVFVTADVDGTDSAAAEWVDTRTTQLGDNLSRAESSLWSFGIGSTIVMIGVFSPVGALIALVIGLIIIFFLGILTPLSMTALILAAVVGIAISLKVKT